MSVSFVILELFIIEETKWQSRAQSQPSSSRDEWQYLPLRRVRFPRLHSLPRFRPPRRLGRRGRQGRRQALDLYGWVGCRGS
jgi:hypothetical protein